METDGGAKGAAGGGRRADAGGLPRRSLAPGAPASGASPQRRLGHPHLQRRPGVAGQPAETLLEPKARRPAAKGGAVVPTPPLLRGAPTQTHPSPLPALPDAAHCGARAGGGWGGGAPRVSLTLTAAGARAGPALLRRRCQSARPGWLPAFLPRALRPQALPRPAPRPHSRSQVQLPGSTPAPSPPLPKPQRPST